MISTDEVSEVCNSLNVNLSATQLRQMVNLVDSDGKISTEIMIFSSTGAGRHPKNVSLRCGYKCTQKEREEKEKTEEEERER